MSDRRSETNLLRLLKPCRRRRAYWRFEKQQLLSARISDMNQDFCHHRQSETVRHFQRTADGTEAVDGSNSRISHYQTVFVAQIGCTEITFINSALSCRCRSLRSTSSSWARRGAESWYPSRAQTATEGFYILMLDPCATPLARRRRPLPAGVLDLHIHTASYYLRSVFALAVFFGFTVTGNIIITVALAWWS